MTDADADVLIAGDGITGLVAGTLFARAGYRTMVIGSGDTSAPAPVGDLSPRTFNLTPATRNILRRAAIWQRLDEARCGTFSRIEVCQPGMARSLSFRPPPEHRDAMGWIVEHEALLAAAASAFDAAGGTRCAGTVSGLDAMSPPAPLLDDGRRLEARLLVGADGARSTVRAGAGLDVDTRDFHQRAMVANVTTTLPHAHVARQIFLPSGPLAFLPLPDARACAIVWSCDLALADELESLDDAAFAARCAKSFEHALGQLRVVSARRSFPLVAQRVRRWVAGGVAIVGDAAHVIHPLAGQGLNLGIADCAALLESVHGPVDACWPGHAALRRYERWRKSEALAFDAMTAMLDRLFRLDGSAAARVRAGGMQLVDRLPGLSTWFAERAMGRAGDLPAMARDAVTGPRDIASAAASTEP